MDDCQTIRQSLVDDESNAVRLDGCSIVQSITTADNPPAQRLYDPPSPQADGVRDGAGTFRARHAERQVRKH